MCLLCKHSLMTSPLATTLLSHQTAALKPLLNKILELSLEFSVPRPLGCFFKESWTFLVKFDFFFLKFDFLSIVSIYKMLCGLLKDMCKGSL